jgi:archaellum biogenesis protein FlaJ (TadC family)
MDFSKLRWSDWLAAAGGIVLAISVFVPKTYEARPESPNAQIDGLRGTVSIWQVHDIIRWLLVLAAIAPIVLIYIIARDHELSWPRGEMTAVIGLTAATLLFYNGIIDRPGEPSGQIELDWSWYTAFAGALAMTIGGAVRSSEVERKRKPPGVL